VSATAAFSAAEQALIDDAARRVVAARLAVPAMLFLETISPMNLLTASMLHALTPVLGLALPPRRLEELARLLERRESIPAFIAAIDAAEDSRRRGTSPS